jgi:hypothetical protein
VDCSVVRTDRGRRFRLSKTLQCEPEVPWKLLTEVKYWPEWGPLLTNVDYPDPTIKQGTRVRVQLIGFIKVPFDIDRVTDELWTWSLFGGTPPADGHRVEAVDNYRSRVSFELPLWAPFYLPICALGLRKIQSLIKQFN